MIIFHEGLPRSGKSYEVFKEHVVPRLKEGRGCTGYVEGVNHVQIAGLAGITVDKCKELLIVITREQVPEIYKFVRKDDLVLIDEAQNFWPHRRQPLGPEITQFVTEHGHLGLDIVLMGQVFGDVHSLWRGRTARKVYFQKLDALGAAKAYKWIAYARQSSASGREKWAETGSGEKFYDPAYFGCYKSHEDGVENKANYKDDRFNLFKNRYFRMVLPATAVLALVGLWYAWGFFHGDKLKPKAVAQTVSGAIQPVQAVQGAKVSPLATAAKDEPSRVNQDDIPADMVERLSKVFRLRLVGTWASTGATTNGIIEWRTADNALVNRLTFRDIEGMGYSVFVNREVSVVYIAKGRVNVMAVSWSLKDDAERQVQDARLNAQPALQSAPPALPPSVGLGEPFPARTEPRMVDAASLKS